MCLQITNLNVTAGDLQILNGVDLVVENGSTTVLMGPNGSGKSTLAQVIMGHPAYQVHQGTITFNDDDVLELEPNERSQKGLFLSFQYPSEIPGVDVSNYLRLVYNIHHNANLSPVKFRNILQEKMDFLEMPADFAKRSLNEGFSGGEKKRMEMLQLLIIEPKLAILDETDSGLDVDALKLVGKTVEYLKEQNNMSVLLITHYTRILKYIDAHKVYIMKLGKIIQTGGKELAHELEEKGFKGKE
jgi:Fe-S cluster assembly ATP-binding protein